MSKWFRMKAARKGVAEISIFSDIGWFGLTASDFHEALASVGKPEELHISIASNGGDVATGFAIYNMLARHPAHKVVTVEGLAASMASVIAMAGDEIVMPENSQMMIHNPWGAISGESDQIASFAEALETMQDNIVDAYKKRTGLARSEIEGMMAKETWLGAERAVELGFADRTDDPVQMAASLDVSRFEHVPAAFAKSLRAASRTRKDIGSNNQESTMSKKSKIDAAVEDQEDFPADTPKTEEEIRTELLAYQKEVRSVCQLASKPELAQGFIDANKSVADVIAELEAKAEEAAKKGKKDDVSARHNPQNDNTPAATLDPAKIWGKYNSAGKNRR